MKGLILLGYKAITHSNYALVLGVLASGFAKSRKVSTHVGNRDFEE